jgi:hypothetical protein
MNLLVLFFDSFWYRRRLKITQQKGCIRKLEKIWLRCCVGYFSHRESACYYLPGTHILMTAYIFTLRITHVEFIDASAGREMDRRLQGSLFSL